MTNNIINLQNEIENLKNIIQKLIIKRQTQTEQEQQQTNKKLTILYDTYFLRLEQLAKINK